MGRIFVMGDVHGAFNALKQCLDRAEFDYQNDTLINLGDVSDGWPQTKECIDELLKIENLIYILGNHDTWTLNWMKGHLADPLWLSQGGEATVNSYSHGIPKSHISFLDRARPYYILDNNRLFVHAGIDPLRSMEDQGLDVFLWDRTLARTALNFYQSETSIKLTTFSEVYLGHTPIPYESPVKACEIWLMDTGAGWSGRLALMEINTKEVFMSDPVTELYPGAKGRFRK